MNTSENSLEEKLVRKIIIRIVPVLMLAYFIAFIDRVNIGFAAAEMNADLGLSTAIYGLGAGIFFIGYFLFEIPSNAALHKYGARIWIARIMITWGLISACSALIQGEKSFFLIRFLLGVAEAGFFPGIIYYLSTWLPARHRAKILGIFYLAIPLAIVFGSVISAPLLLLDGTLGLKGWQWLFIIEAIPAVLVGVYIFLRMAEKPENAAWLSIDEKSYLKHTLAIEARRTATAEKRNGLAVMFKDRRVLYLSAIYFCMNFAGVGLVMFLPLIVSGFDPSHKLSGVIAAVPYAVVACLLPFIGRLSDRYSHNRHVHCIIAALMVFGGLALATTTTNPVVMLTFISIAAIGIYAFALPFWAYSSGFFSGAYAAVAIAAVNSVGNLSGFLSPFVMGILKDSTQSFNAALICIALGPLISAILFFIFKRTKKTQGAISSGSNLSAHH
ncbi:MFS transporter [Pantoea cypripedii]|uniref:MFS transporter n=1 Tax=Pantoea cypripedii TaxID=55209 RepID=UPI002FCA6E3A